MRSIVVGSDAGTGTRLVEPSRVLLRGRDDVALARVELRRSQHGVRRAVVKREEGFSGEGNAIFSFDGAPNGRALARWLRYRDQPADPAYRGLTPDDLIDIAVNNALHFHAATQQRVTFHLIGALSQLGKRGTVCIGETRADAERYFPRQSPLPIPTLRVSQAR